MSVAWRTIVEPGWLSIVEPVRAEAATTPSPRPHDPIVLRGELVVEPDAYARVRSPGSRRRLTVGALVGALHSVISWTASLLLHLLPAIFLMGLILLDRPQEDGLVSIGFHVRDASPLVDGEKREAPPTEPDKPKEPKELEPPRPEPEPPPEPPPPVPLPPEPALPAPAPEPEKPAVIGTGPQPAAPAPPPAAVDPKKIESDPGAAVRETRAEDLETLRQGRKTDIVVATGVYDQTEIVLAHLGIPHTAIEPSQLGAYDLSGCAALFIDCTNTYAQNSGVDGDTIAQVRKDIERLEKRLKSLQDQVIEAEKKKDARLARLRGDLRQTSANLEWKKKLVSNLVDVVSLAKKLRAFVAGGGYLFTSDWGITLIEKAFRGSVRVGGTVGPKTVKIAPRRGAEKHALLREVFTVAGRGSTTPQRSLRWEIDSSSYLIRTESAKVEVLVESQELSSSCKAIVVTFRHDGEGCVDGRESKAGRVMHTLSHFADQVDRMGDFALQNMLVNFLVERFASR